MLVSTYVIVTMMGSLIFFKKVHQLYFIVSFKIAILFVVAEIFLDWMSSENDKSLK